MEHMEGTTEPQKSLECSGRLILECGCGERLVLLGLKEDWLSEQRTDFECQCGQNLTLDNELNEDIIESGELYRVLSRSPAVDVGVLFPYRTGAELADYLHIHPTPQHLVEAIYTYQQVHPTLDRS